MRIALDSEEFDDRNFQLGFGEFHHLDIGVYLAIDENR